MKRKTDPIEDIEKRLSDLHSNEWKVRLDDLGGATHYACIFSGDSDDVVMAVDTGLEDVEAARLTQEFKNASFMADCPTLISFLLEEVRRLRLEREDFLAELYKVKAKLRETTAQAVSLSAALAAEYERK